MYQTVTGLESFLQLLNDPESELPPPPATQLCHHDTEQDLCEYTTPEDRSVEVRSGQERVRSRTREVRTGEDGVMRQNDPKTGQVTVAD